MLSKQSIPSRPSVAPVAIFIGGASFLAWLAAGALVVIDAIMPRFPTPVTFAVLLIAATGTLIAMSEARSKRAEAQIADLIETLRWQAALDEQAAHRSADVQPRRRRSRKPITRPTGISPEVIDMTRKLTAHINGTAG